MAYRRNIVYKTILSAKAANGIGTTIDVRDWQNATIRVLPNSATLTVQCQGSASDTAPTFSSASSPTNEWDYISMFGLSNGAIVDGATGISYSGSSTPALYNLNTEGLTWLNFVVSGYGSGSVTVKITLFNP